MFLKDIIDILEIEFPPKIAEDWDNVGHIIGCKDDIVKRIQISLDLTQAVVNRAIEKGVDLIITHHPPIFNPINKVNDSSILGKKILKLVRHGVNVYTLHTNLDSAKDGLNQYIAEKLKGVDIKVMDEISSTLYTLKIYCNEEKSSQILKVLEDMSKVRKFPNKIEIKGTYFENFQILSKLRSKINFLETDYELIKLENKEKTNQGIGRIFKVDGDYNLEEYINYVKEVLSLDHLRLVKVDNRKIKKVIIVNGSGSSFWRKALTLKADLFITGDLKYHEALDAYESGLNILDIGHYESEYFFGELIIKKLSDNLEIDVYNEERIFEFR